MCDLLTLANNQCIRVKYYFVIRVMYFVVIIGIIIIHDDDCDFGYYDCCCCCLPSVEARQPVILQVVAGSSHTAVRCL